MESGGLSINGDVGIGTTSPSGKLDVETAGGERIVFDSAGSSQQPRISLVRDSGADFSIVNSLGVYRLYKDTSEIYRFASDSHIWSTSTASSAVRIASNGNLGLATTTPAYPLDVQTNTGARVFSTDTNTKESILRFGGDSAGAQSKTAIIAEPTGSWGRGDLHVCVNTEGNTNNADLTGAVVSVVNTGRVGVNTKDPGAALHVADEDAIKFGASKTEDTGVLAGYNEGGNYFILEAHKGSDNSEKYDLLLQRYGGDVGINTSNPVSKLHVAQGDISVDNNKGIYGQQTDGNFRRILHIGTNNSTYVNARAVESTTDELRFQTNRTDRVILKNDGKFGIGTSDPANELSLVGTGNATTGWTVGNEDGNTSGGIFNSGSTSNSISISADPNNVGGASKLELKLDGTERLGIYQGGNIGIGDSSPQGQLSVRGNGSQYNTTLLLNAEGGAESRECKIRMIGNNTTGSTSQIVEFVAYQPSGANAGDSALDINVRNNGDGFSSPNLCATFRAGRLGIGTNAPGYPIHVKSGSFTTLYIEATTNDACLGLKNAESGGEWSLRNDVSEDDNFAVRYDNSARFIVTKSGQVGIGKSSGISAKLDVVGDIKGTSVIGLVRSQGSAYLGGSSTYALQIQNSSSVRKADITYEGIATFANTRIMTGSSNPANFTTALDEAGNQYLEYTGPTLDVRDRLEKFGTALETLKAEAAVATTIAGLKTAIANALANI